MKPMSVRSNVLLGVSLAAVAFLTAAPAKADMASKSEQQQSPQEQPQQQ